MGVIMDDGGSEGHHGGWRRMGIIMEDGGSGGHHGGWREWGIIMDGGGKWVSTWRTGSVEIINMEDKITGQHYRPRLALVETHKDSNSHNDYNFHPR